MQIWNTKMLPPTGDCTRAGFGARPSVSPTRPYRSSHTDRFHPLGALACAIPSLEGSISRRRLCNGGTIFIVSHFSSPPSYTHRPLVAISFGGKWLAGLIASPTNYFWWRGGGSQIPPIQALTKDVPAQTYFMILGTASVPSGPEGPGGPRATGMTGLPRKIGPKGEREPCSLGGPGMIAL